MACKRSSVRSRLPPPNLFEKFAGVDHNAAPRFLTLSSRGLGHHPFTVATGVRIPVGSPNWLLSMKRKSSTLDSEKSKRCLPGAVVQLVRIPACHAGGRGFESRPLRQYKKSPANLWFAGLFALLLWLHMTDSCWLFSSQVQHSEGVQYLLAHKAHQAYF